MKFQQDAIKEVYQIILRKMIHSRFAVVFRRWKEEHCQKHDMSLRSSLKAGVDKIKKSKDTKRPATPHPAGVDNNKKSKDTKRPANLHPDAEIDVKKLKTS